MSGSDNSLIDLLSGLAVEEGAQATRIAEVSVLKLTRPNPRAPVVYEPSIVFVAQGKKTGYLGTEIYHYDPENYLVLSVPLPFECETDASPAKPLLAVSLQLDLFDLSELLLEMGETAPPAESTPRGMYSTPITVPLADALTRLARSLYSESESRILGKGIVKEIMFRVLSGPQGGALRIAAARHSHFGRISKILRRLHSEYLKPLDVTTLAREAGMSPSTFHHTFKLVTSTSPLQYLKNIRLHKARLLMTQDGISAGTAAAQVGYESASQFSREFKRLFGTTPAASAGTRHP